MDDAPTAAARRGKAVLAFMAFMLEVYFIYFSRELALVQGLTSDAGHRRRCYACPLSIVAKQKAKGKPIMMGRKIFSSSCFMTQ
jgi:hypothetical protein